MNTNVTTCEKCGVTYAVGSWPFCKGGHGRAQSSIQTDEAWIGGKWIENLGHEPVLVTSRQDLKRQMALHGCEQRIKHVPGDKYLINHAVPSAYTLECARILLTRGHESSTEPPLWTREPEFSVRVLSSGEVTPVTRKVE